VDYSIHTYDDTVIMSKVLTIYSANRRVNSTITKLLAINGQEELWDAVNRFIREQATDWSDSDIWELYRAARWVSNTFKDYGRGSA